MSHALEKIITFTEMLKYAILTPDRTWLLKPEIPTLGLRSG
jgi:hypothetical protein